MTGHDLPPDAGTEPVRSAVAPVEPTLERHWQELVTAALLGTDRRDPPAPVGPLVDLVADTARVAPSERMLAHVAACTAVRRAGVLPAPAAPPLAPPPPDERPVCPPAAVERWHHVTSSWPVLEDEWMRTLLANGWRAAPELLPAMLRRHRADPHRRERALEAAGPLGPWLIEQLPELGPGGPARATPRRTVNSVPGSAPIGGLPELPIPPDLAPLLDAAGAEAGRVIATGLEAGTLGPSHRAVLVNLIARARADGLAELSEVLDAVDPATSGHGLASVLSDLALTRRRMLDELQP